MALLKIAIVAPKIYPALKPSVNSTYGGAEIALSVVARELAHRDHIKVCVLAGDYGQPAVETIDGIEIHRALKAGASPATNGLRLVTAIRKVAADIYVQRTLTVASFVIALACRLRRSHFIYWVAHDHETDGGHPLYRRIATRLLVHGMYRLASYVIVQNDYECRQLRQRFPNVRCSIIKKGMKIPAPAEPTREIYDGVWVGRCDEWKNPEAFIELARAFPDKRFLMILPPALGKERHHANILQIAATCANLEVRGRTRNQEVLELVAKSRVYCMTSVQEGDWPVVVLEAASLTKPILSLHLNYGDLISQYGGGVFCDGNVSSFSDNFQELMQNDARRLEMGRNAHRYVSDVHNLDKQTAKLVKIFDELA